MAVDLRLYALVDPAVAGGRSLAELAASIANSATLVQLRDKHGSTRAMLSRCVPRAASRAVPLVNDVDVALAAEADGAYRLDDCAGRRAAPAGANHHRPDVKTLEQAKAAPRIALTTLRSAGLRYDFERQYGRADRHWWTARDCRCHP
jgi:thiamine-phosphate pyrophosphorylase